MILQNSLMELMKTRPVSDISVKEICALADISRPTFYAHCRSPHDLLRQIENEALVFYGNVHSKYHDKPTGVVLRRGVEEILGYIRENVNFMRILFGTHGDIEFQKKLFGFAIRECLLDYSTNKNIDRETQEYYVVFKTSGIIALIQRWLESGMKKPIEEMSALITKLLYSIR
jgi:AcrR family transcriptional regulator